MLNRSRPRASAACIVRRVSAADANASVALLIASITTLCVEDHMNDPETLARWLRNKTVANFERWMEDPDNVMVVAEVDSVICGVGLLHGSGAVRLCYVLPGMQRSGVGRALMGRLQHEAATRRSGRLNLTSTSTARGFYERLGFTPDGEGKIAFGVLKEYPYTKLLEPA